MVNLDNLVIRQLFKIIGVNDFLSIAHNYALIFINDSEGLFKHKIWTVFCND